MSEENWRARVVAAYREQGTFAAAAEVLGVSRQRVHQVLAEEDPSATRHNRNMSPVAYEALEADAFGRWCERALRDRNWSGRECARRLGCSANSIKVWREGGAPRYVGLACAALERDLEPVK